MKYHSVIGFGNVSIINDTELKIKALDVLMEYYACKAVKYPQDLLKNTVIVILRIESITGKISGY